MLILVELIAALAAILLAAALFTNSVEILGHRLNMGQGAVGSVLAAVGTALPETMIPIVAVVGALFMGRDPETAGEIGIGAILGAPFLLATLAMFVVGASVIGFRGRRRSGTEVQIDRVVTRRDVAFFLVFFALAAGAGLVELGRALNIVVAVVFIGAYAGYTYWTLRSGGAALEEVPEKLTIWRGDSRPPTFAVVVQVLGSLAVMIGGAHLFVDGVEHGSDVLGIPAGLISLVLAPLATELPEKFNSVFWLRDNKDTLALGNITGAMVFQSTLPVSIGLLFTSWNLNFISVVAVGLALFSGVLLFALLHGKHPIKGSLLLTGGVFYAAFVVVAIVDLL